MQPHLLVIAFHFPPIQGSSGVHRTLSFSRYLAEFGWKVTVLTAHERAYANVRAENEALIPPDVEVIRALAWDTVRHFSIRQRYPRLLALPDRWQSWIVGGVLSGLRFIRKQRPHAIYSTFPIASAHVIGLTLQRLTGVPWIADFRDPMTQEDYPKDESLRRLLERIEGKVFGRAAGICVTTPSAASYYRSRFPGAAEKIRVIGNGFDPTIFGTVSEEVAGLQAVQDRKLILLHSGLLYPVDRNPEPFLRALRELRDSGKIQADSVELRLRASGFDDQYAALVSRLGLGDMVKLLPPLPYEAALRELLSADALVLFQGSGVNRQIPAKLYEYLYASRPIIGITDPDGDTGMTLREFGIPGIARLEDSAAIRSMLEASLRGVREGRYPIPLRRAVMKYSREHGARELESWLSELTGAMGSAKTSDVSSG
jgi:hypothetical protein